MCAEYRIPRGKPSHLRIDRNIYVKYNILTNIPTNTYQYLPIHNLVQKHLAKKNILEKIFQKSLKTFVNGRKLVYKLRLTNIPLWEQTVRLKEDLSYP